MSHEITEVSSENKGSVELQPFPPPSEENPTIVGSKPSPATTKETQKRKRGFRIRQIRQNKNNEKDWFSKMRGWIMIVGVQVAAITYASGLNPPGGLWPDDKDGHVAGHAILHDKSKSRYTTFYYANATAFMASLVIIVLIMNEKFYLKRSKVVVLNFSMVLGLMSLMLAYAAGSARRITTSIYVIVLAVGNLVFVFLSSHFLKHAGLWITKCCPFMGQLCPRCMRMIIRKKANITIQSKKKKTTNMHKTARLLCMCD
ncbi:hypothetical protein LUZ63_007258 [Rhynchospora breviuscula]|uniref:PGG domain-containing protein n=1 Tax=Rhynchospora breviuscula TaxID=2022672 RepID=A0A9Q0CRH9_9POAL|nr:hypothetical protein LUZ63_007258 [Rhynchospora breviuscula]